MGCQWFAPHAAGFGPLVLRLAERDYPGSKPGVDGDNAIRLWTKEEPVRLLAYCRGLFRVLAEGQGGLERAARAIASDPRTEPGLAVASGRPLGPRRGGHSPSSRAFVLRSFGAEDPASLSRGPREAIEGLISRITGMRPDSERPEREYRLQERADGSVLFLERGSQGPEGGAGPSGQPRRGELPRTTCRLLAEMTGPEAGDVFLDPFCGYGGIALERALCAPYRFIFASDLDADKIAALKSSLSTGTFARRRRTIFPKLRDALDASAFEAGFLSAIATDPPWGVYEGGLSKAGVAELFLSHLAEARRALAPGGRLVLLVSRELDAEDLSRRLGGGRGPELELRESLDVLISGKKARALRLERARP